MRPPDVTPDGRGSSAVEVGGCCEQHGDDRHEGQGRVREVTHARVALDLQGVHLLRQPGYLHEARGFASPPRDGFAIYRSIIAGHGVDRWQQTTAVGSTGARGLVGWVRTVPAPDVCVDRHITA